MKGPQMFITLTDSAISQIKQNLQKRGRGKGIQIGVRTTGCSGLAYTIEYFDGDFEQEKFYNIAGVEGCMVVSLKEHEFILDGLTVDYVRKGLNEGFEFTNKNERDRCGCGESFRI
jgi:iron-sulfur cluster assembly protein